MKSFFFFAFSLLLTSGVFAQQKESPLPDPAKKTYTVDAACGQCRLGLKGKGCNLAIRMNGTAYFVDGTDIDSHGDAHADDGFCNKVRRANVQGEVVNGRFKASYFSLLPNDGEKGKQ